MGEYTGRRITAEEVEAAYRAIDGKPIRGVMKMARDGHDCYCGLGAVLERRNRNDPDPDSCRFRFTSDLLGLTSGYVFGFTEGFDGLVLNRPLLRNPVDYAAGFFDGQTSAAHVFASA